MAPPAADLLSEALALPVRERAGIAHQLILSLGDGADADEADAWVAELEQRARDVRSGSVATEDRGALKARLTQRWRRRSRVRLRLHPGAAADLASAGDWYEQQLPGLGADVADEGAHALDTIAERPLTWALWPGVGEAIGVRRVLLARFSFAVGHLDEENEIGPGAGEVPCSR